MSSQDPIPPVRNYCVRELFKRNRIFCCRDEPISHRGNSCAAGTCSFESHVLCERDYSSGTKEVGWHSCQQIAPGKCSFNRNLKIGHEIGTSLWSRWQRSRRRCSLEFDGTKIAKSVPEVCKLRILGPGLDSIHFLRKPQDQVPMLHEIQSSRIPYCTFVPFKDTQVEDWQRLNCWSRRYSIQLDRVHISQRMFFRLFFISQARTRCWRKKQVKMDDKQFLRTSQSDTWNWTRRNIDKRRLHENKNGTVSMQVEDAVYWVSSARAQDEGLQFWQTTVECHCCIQFLPSECIYKVIFRNGERVFFFWERLATARPPPKVALKKVPGNCSSSSSKTLLGVHQLAAGNILRKFWWRKRWKNPGNSTEESETSRSRKNCCGVMWQTSLMLKKRLNLK